MENEILAYSVPQFCRAFGIKRGLFYRLVKEGYGPKILKIGKRTLVRREEAERWAMQMESREGE